MQTIKKSFTSIILKQKSILPSCRWIASQAFSFIEAEELQLDKPVHLRGRPFLPDADKDSFPLFLNGPKKDFPLALKAQGANTLEEWGKLCRKEIDENLLRYGAILFRQLPLASIEDFQTLFQRMDFPDMDYDCGSGHRASLAPRIYSASDEPPEFSIELHNELAYLPTYNKKIFFFCVTPCENGGETVICKNSDLLDQLDERFVQKVKAKKLRYLRQCKDKTLCEYISWQSVFNTNSREVAEAKMKELNCEWQWSNDNTILKFWYIMDAFDKHHVTGEEVWFNQAHAMHDSYFKAHPAFQDIETESCFFPNHCTYGDGEEIEPEFLEQIRAAGWSCGAGISLNKGDLMVLDNMSVQHSRLSFKGNRKIAVALCH